MFTFFVNLFLSIVSGRNCFIYDRVNENLYWDYSSQIFNKYFNWLGNMFNNSTSNSINFTGVAIGSIVNGVYTPAFGFNQILFDISYILALICCIGVFWLIIDCFKRVFSCFTEWFR